MNQLNSNTSIFSSLLLGWAGIFMFLILPLFVGAVSEEMNLDAQQVGYLASADLFGFFLGSVSSIGWARRVNWRMFGILALVMITIANVLTFTLAVGFSIFLILRVLSGIGQGAAVSIYSAHVGDTKQPERHYANFLIGQTILGAIGLFLLPKWIGNIGSEAVLWTQIGLCILALSMSLKMPPRGVERASAFKNLSFSTFKIPLLGLLALLLFFVAQGGTWAYMSKIGSSFQLSDEFIGLSLSLAMIGAFLGSTTASVLAIRWGRRLPLLVIGIGQPLCLLLIFSNFGNWSFLAGIIAFLFLWNLAIPYLMGILIGLDKSGISILAANPTFALGVSIAPIIIGQFVINNQFSPVGLLGAIAMLMSIGLFLITLRYVEKP